MLFDTQQREDCSAPPEEGRFAAIDTEFLIVNLLFPLVIREQGPVRRFVVSRFVPGRK